MNEKNVSVATSVTFMDHRDSRNENKADVQGIEGPLVTTELASRLLPRETLIGCHLPQEQEYSRQECVTCISKANGVEHTTQQHELKVDKNRDFNKVYLGRQSRRGRSKTGPASITLLASHVNSGKFYRTSKRNAFRQATVPGSVHRRLWSERQNHMWITVFKRMFRDLAEQSDKTRQAIDKETFLEYFPLPGILGERLFDLFDIDRSETIDFYEFFRGLCIIYNGTLEEKKRFLFDMYDLDNNGFISRAEVSALLSHIPVAFKVFHHMAHSDLGSMDHYSSTCGGELLGRKKYPSKTMEGHINALVHSIFSDTHLLNEASEELVQPIDVVEQNNDAGLTFDEFCAALEKSKEISDVLELFYDNAMPDLPIPVAAFTPSSFKESQKLFSSSMFDVDYMRPQRWLQDICHHAIQFLKRPRALKKLSSFQCTQERAASSLSSQSLQSFSRLPKTGCIAPDIHSLSLEVCTSENGTRNDFYDVCNPLVKTSSLEPESCIALSGWLYKMGRIFNIKCYRFYALRNQFLYYFSKKNALAPRNAMFLRGARISTVCVTDPKTSSFAFDIELSYHRQRVKRFYAKDRKERDLWVQTLSRAACTSRFHEEYLLQKCLGRGRFAAVYQGIRKRTQELVAIKIIPKTAQNQPRKNKAFLRNEVCVLWLTQQHPNIVRLIDVHESSDHVYVVIEWVPGGDVLSLASQFPHHQNHLCYCSASTEGSSDPRMITIETLAETLANAVARGVLEGLVCLHKYNIVHRDLKPENILLVMRGNGCTSTTDMQRCGPLDQTSSSQHSIKACPCESCSLCCVLRTVVTVQLTDFGLSAILNPQGHAKEPLGTLSYAPPEVIRARPYGKPVDIWALGVLTYQLLSACRQLPFEFLSDDKLADAIVAGHYSFEPSSYWDNVSTRAKDFVTSLLRRSPSSRPTASEALNHPWLTLSHLPGN